MAQGLTGAEVAERIRLGLVNRTQHSDWLDYAHIVGRNLFTGFNAMVTPAAFALFFLHEFQGAIAVSGMALVNTALGLAQEIRAKRQLARLAILVETRVQVVRDGQIREIAASTVVRDEQILLHGGELVVADGTVLEASFLEVDEALLTGESEPVRRQPGARLLSGSTCVAGAGVYRADNVGRAAFANQTEMKGREYRAQHSPLTLLLNRLVRLLSTTAITLIVIFTISYVSIGFPKDRAQDRAYVRMVAATITSMVPQGLVLTATIAFSLGGADAQPARRHRRTPERR